MLWLRTLELDKKTQKQSWQVVADLDTIQALKIYSKFFFQLHQPDDNLPEKVWSVRATATAYLIAVYGSEVHNYSIYNDKIWMHNVHWHSVFGLTCKNIIVLSLCMNV